MRAAHVKYTHLMEIDLDALVKSWERSLRAERKSPDTIRTYTTGARFYLRWCRETGWAPTLTHDTVTEWVTALLDEGKAPATVVARLRGVRRFSAWLAAKGEIGHDDLVSVKPPQLDEPLVPSITTEQVAALLATCTGKEFHQVRDRAVIRFMTETGIRASELTNMELDDIDLDRRRAVIIRGKGGRGRLVGFSPQCCAAVDDYLRLRRRHRLAASPALWLGADGRRLGYWGLYNSLRRRGESIGLKDFHPHILRHTSAVTWLRKGGSPTGLMAQAGWQSVDMLRRYIRAAEAELAAEEADRLDLGDM